MGLQSRDRWHACVQVRSGTAGKCWEVRGSTGKCGEVLGSAWKCAVLRERWKQTIPLEGLENPVTSPKFDVTPPLELAGLVKAPPEPEVFPPIPPNPV